MDIMGKIDILDLVSINVTVDRFGHLFIDIACIEEGKQVVLSEEISRALGEKATEVALGKSKNDENVIGYIKEYTGKMLSEAYKNGLVEIEDIPDAKEDPYKKFRKVDRLWD